MRKRFGWSSALPTFVQTPRVSRWPEGKDPYPAFHRGDDGVRRIADEAIKEGRVGYDLEFSPSTGKPHIIGVASQNNCAATEWSDSLARDILDATVAGHAVYVGHAVMEADKAIIEKYFGITTPSSMWEDSMLLGYLDNQDWAAAPGKTEDENDKGSLGLMNLGTMGTYYLGIPQWKQCRGTACFGPCPEHDEQHYCAIDSWAGLRIADKARTRVNLPLYEGLKQLSVYCGKMSSNGVAVDRDYIAVLEEQISTKKADLFPSEMRLKTERCKVERKFWLTPFNPNSSDQKLKYFTEAGIPLLGKGGKPAADRDAIRRALEKQFRKLKVSYEVDRKSGILTADDDIEIPEPVEYLYRIDQYARAGKGLKSWFADEYIGKDSYVHPRFIVTGTSTGRLSSSSPNFQNVPKRGFGSLVRAAIVPRHKSLRIMKADKGQLELRIVLFYAEVEQPPFDAFTWLVEKAAGAFDQAASRFAMKPRDIAKSLAHAANYLEGLVVLSEAELATKTRKREIANGALLVCRDWYYRGGYVCFTGANLAERLFGDKTDDHRRDALALQEIYLSQAFPAIRRWHRRLSEEIDTARRVVSHTGRSINLYGSPEDDLKLAAAFLGQGGGADEVQEGMLRYDYLNQVALLQVHDELVFEGPREWGEQEIKKFFEPFWEPSARFGGWKFPIEISYGDNWCSANPDTNPNGLVVIK